jgi:uncharacterized protein
LCPEIIKREKTFIYKTLIGMASAAFILMVTTFFQGGFVLVGNGFIKAIQIFVGIIPLLIVAFLVAGLVTVLIPKSLVSKWLGKEAGWKGPLLGSLLGTLVPGGPFFFYPLMAALTLSGANIGTMISFVAAKTLWNISRLPIEIAFVGVEITLIRFIITFPIPILAGVAVDKLLPGFAEEIRADINRLQLKRARLGDGKND